MTCKHDNIRIVDISHNTREGYCRDCGVLIGRIFDIRFPLPKSLNEAEKRKPQ